MVAAQASSAFLLCLLTAHTIFNRLKISISYGGLSLLQLYTAAFWTICIIRRRNDYIAFNRMMIAEILINIGSRNLTCRNGTDHGSRTGYTVSPGKYAFHVFHTGMIQRVDSTMADRDTLFRKMLRFYTLTNGHNDDITGYPFFLCIRLLG